MLSLGQAAKAAGVPKTTLSRAIKTGRLSASRTDTGAYAIDPAELARAFPPVQLATPEPSPEVQALREVADLLKGKLADRDKTIENLERDVSRWHTAFEQAQRQLSPPAVEPWTIYDLIPQRWRKTG
jgi:hypothetical protein